MANDFHPVKSMAVKSPAVLSIRHHLDRPNKGEMERVPDGSAYVCEIPLKPCRHNSLKRVYAISTQQALFSVAEKPILASVPMFRKCLASADNQGPFLRGHPAPWTKNFRTRFCRDQPRSDGSGVVNMRL